MVKKYVKKRRVLKKRPSVKKLAKKVNKLYRAIETKHFRVAGLGALPDNDPSLAIRPYGFGIGTGDYGARIGDKITAKWLKFKSIWDLSPGIGGVAARIIVFVMKANPDAIANSWITIYNLYQESAFSNSLNVVNANKDYDNKSNFVTLYDKKVVMNPTTETLTTSKAWDFDIRIPPALQNVQYFSGSGSNISKNELFIALIAEQDSSFAINYNAEIFYQDA